MIPEPFTVHLEAADNHDAVDAIEQGLTAFNVAIAGPDHRQRLILTLRDDQGGIVGGLVGDTFYGWLFVALLWVAEEARGRGHGRALLEAAEAEAVRRGCRHAFLDTLSFQAPGFYQMQGYRVFGVLDNLPAGHQRIYLTKPLFADDRSQHG